MSDADMKLSIDINLMGVIWMCRAALPQMVRQQYGRIVNTTSGGAFGVPLLTSYAGPKAGVIGYTRALAVEVAGLATSSATSLARLRAPACRMLRWNPAQ